MRSSTPCTSSTPTARVRASSALSTELSTRSTPQSASQASNSACVVPSLKSTRMAWGTTSTSSARLSSEAGGAGGRSASLSADLHAGATVTARASAAPPRVHRTIRIGLLLEERGTLPEDPTNERRNDWVCTDSLYVRSPGVQVREAEEM